MRICLLEKIKEQLQLVLIQLKIKTKKTSTISENPTPLLGPMPINRKRVVTVLVAMTNLRPISGQSTSKKGTKENYPSNYNKSKVRKSTIYSV